MNTELKRRAFRAAILHFLADPAQSGAAQQYFDDGILVVEAGRVIALGEAEAVLPTLVPGTVLTDYRGKLILPGFIDTHIHYAQVDVIASYGEQLLTWLDKYIFPAERRFADPGYANEVAGFFVDELLRNGTTTALVFATVHPASVDAVFAAAQRRAMRLIAGKVMMDRNCPDFLSDTAERSYDESRALIDKWHKRDRLLYAVTPRFAPTSTREQMTQAGRLFGEYADIYLQSHVAENRSEVAWVASLYPESRSYLDVYERYGQLGPRSVFAHCIWLDDGDRERLGVTGSAMSFCPTSNLFLGSGLFDLGKAREQGIRVGIGTDVGGGTSFSMLKTLAEGYKVLQLKGQSLSAMQAFYLATLGGARSLYLDAQIGNFEAGREADFVVVDLAATPLMARRMENAATLGEKLFALMMLGDDRAIAATHILGEAAYRRG
jgi:guanine deaminase